MATPLRSENKITSGTKIIASIPSGGVAAVSQGTCPGEI